MEGKPADLILYTAAGGDDLSRAVGAGQFVLGIGKSKRLYSHVALKAFSPGFQHEAKFPFVGFFPIDITRPYEVWRLPGMTHEKAAAMIHEAMRHHGDIYGLATLFTAGRLVLRHEEVCSQLIDMCAKKAGYHFDKERLGILAPDSIPDYPGIRMVYRYTAPQEAA